MKWTAEKSSIFWHHGGEALRECGILWLVFALLDRTVQGSVTFPWAISNGAGAIAVWLIGVYIDVRKVPR